MAMTLDQLANELANSGTQGNAQTLPAHLYKPIATYLNDRILSLLIAVAIIVTIAFVLYGSFLYFTAYGDENKATQAKKSITYAFIGLLISLMAMGIATYVQRSLVGNRAFTEGVSVPVK